MKLIMEVGARDKMKIHLIKNGGAHGAVGGGLLRAPSVPSRLRRHQGRQRARPRSQVRGEGGH